jgi:hypothetical protein
MNPRRRLVSPARSGAGARPRPGPTLAELASAGAGRGTRILAASASWSTSAGTPSSQAAEERAQDRPRSGEPAAPSEPAED